MVTLPVLLAWDINPGCLIESNVILDHPLISLSLNLISHENGIVEIPSLLSGIDEI